MHNNLNTGNPGPGPGASDAEAHAALDQIESEVGADAGPGISGDSPDQPKAPFPTIRITRPAVQVILKNSFPGKKIDAEDVEMLAQVYADVLDYYFPAGVGHPVIAALLVTGIVVGKYYESAPKAEKNPGAEPAHAAA